MAVTAVLLHPHPDMGGDQYNHVISALYLGLPRAGIPAERFDFVSSDVDACAAQTLSVIDRVDGPVALVGYSFGSMVASRVTGERVRGWCLVAPPIDHCDHAIGTDDRPKLLLVPEHDFSAPVDVDWRNTTQHVLPGADHFLGGHTDGVLRLATPWLDDL